MRVSQALKNERATPARGLFAPGDGLEPAYVDSHLVRSGKPGEEYRAVTAALARLSGNEPCRRLAVSMTCKPFIPQDYRRLTVRVFDWPAARFAVAPVYSLVPEPNRTRTEHCCIVAALPASHRQNIQSKHVNMSVRRRIIACHSASSVTLTARFIPLSTYASLLYAE